jgi:hypothetical protein
MMTNGTSYFGRARAATLIALFAFATPPSSQASSIVAPNANQNVDGNANNIAPFSAGLFGDGPSERYQQVYAAS